jgi:hypothetical protein
MKSTGRSKGMDLFRVESVGIKTTREKAFRYISDPKNLPEWTSAFKQVQDSKAIMATPAGALEVGLRVTASVSEGIIDWHMTFPNGSRGGAYSRVIPEPGGSCVYSFMLMAPPVPLEQLEGTLNQQAHILKEELTKLSAILSES